MGRRDSTTRGESRTLSIGSELALVSLLYLLLNAVLTYRTIARLGRHIRGSEQVMRRESLANSADLGENRLGTPPRQRCVSPLERPGGAFYTLWARGRG